MENNNQKEIIKQKLVQLDQINRDLKKDFFGMDSTIDKVINLVKPWYAYGVNKDRPLVINLFGMTGTGKTDLIKSLLNKLNLSNKYLDCRNINKNEFKTLMEGEALIVDEIQNLRTIDEEGNPIRGSMYSISDSNYYWSLLNGDLLTSPEFFRTKLEKKILNLDAKIGYTEMMFRLDQVKVDSDIKFTLYVEEFKKYLELNEHQFNEKDNREIFSIARADFEFDRSEPIKNILIFNLGNIDDLVQDMVANIEGLTQTELNERTTNISPIDIRESLLKMFRAEEVSRFGENHLFMPSIKEEDLYQLVSDKLNRISLNYQSRVGSVITFEPSVSQFLIKEFNIPTQGLRTILSSVNKVVLSAISDKMDFIFDSSVSVSIENNKIILTKQNQSTFCNIYIESEPTYSQDLLKRIALHESAHATIHYLLRHKAPLYMTINSKSKNSGGFVKSEKEDVQTRKSIRDSICISLAGYLIEEIIYGLDGVSTGSVSDIKKATNNAKNYINKFGFGDNLLFHNSDTWMSSAKSLEKNHDEQILRLVHEQKDITKNLLTDNLELVKQLSNLVIEKKSLDKQEMESFFKNFSSNHHLK